MKLNKGQKLLLKNAKKGYLPNAIEKELKKVIDGFCVCDFTEKKLTIFDDGYDGPEDRNEKIKFTNNIYNRINQYFMSRFGEFGLLLLPYLERSAYEKGTDNYKACDKEIRFYNEHIRRMRKLGEPVLKPTTLREMGFRKSPEQQAGK